MVPYDERGGTGFLWETTNCLLEESVFGGKQIVVVCAARHSMSLLCVRATKWFIFLRRNFNVAVCLH